MSDIRAKTSDMSGKIGFFIFAAGDSVFIITSYLPKFDNLEPFMVHEYI